jgi:hypothetical protein
MCVDALGGDALGDTGAELDLQPSGRLNPQNNDTRAEALTAVFFLVSKKAKPDY